MARNTKLVDLDVMGEINLTPMMDLTFVLLITFMITFPIIEKGVPIKLPTGEGESIESPEAMVVTIDGSGKLFLGEMEKTHGELLASLTEARNIDPDTEVQLRGDEGIAYGKVMEVIRVFQKAKVSNMGLVTDGIPDGGP